MDLNFNLTDVQTNFLSSDKKFKLMFGGVGSGKSYVATLNIVIHALRNPGSLSVIVMPNHSAIKNVAYVLFEELCPKQLIKSINLSDRDIKLTNGSRIIFRSGHDESGIQKLRGISISAFWVDEISLLPESVWDVLVGRLRQYNMPYLGIATSNPRRNWTYHKFILKDLSNEYLLLKDIATTTNTFLPQEYVDTLKQEYTGAHYNQELLGQFVAFEGLVYDFKIKELPEYKNSEVFYGFDVGWTDPMAIVVVKKIGTEYYVVDELYKTHLTNDDVIIEFKKLMSKWGEGKVFCDPSAPGTIETLKRAGIKIVAAKNKREDGIRVTSNMVNSNLFISITCENLITEGQDYVFNDSDSKTLGTDHLCDALRYVCFGLNEKTNVNRFTITGRS